MRWLIGLTLLLFALGTLRVVGCGEGPECLTDEDCDDGNECTVDYCDSGAFYCGIQLVHSQLNGNACERDGVPGVCMEGVCEEAECLTDEDCDDQNECTVDSCATSPPYYYYVCRNRSVQDATPCESDGNPGECRCGVCVVDPECSTEEDCDDGNECTWDYCDYCGVPGGSCRYGTDFTECEPCDRSGAPGVCMAGVCEEAECLTGTDCDDGNECTRDSCRCGGCENPPTNQCGPCDWNGASGVCVSGVCSEDLCEGVTCNDGNLCTDDECDCSDGTCSFTPRDCDDGTPCTEDRCDPRTGCYYPNAPDGTDCGPCTGYEPCGWPPLWSCCTGYGHCENGECIWP